MKSFHVAFELYSSVTFVAVLTLQLLTQASLWHFLTLWLLFIHPSYHTHRLQSISHTAGTACKSMFTLSLAAGCLSFFCFDSAGGGKVVTHQSSALNLYFRTDQILSAALCSFSCQNGQPAFSLITPPVVTPPQRIVLQMIRFPFCSKNVSF